tara:strand:+ start:479 stop:676 length:198 start_codon:yes stop_codon:yes gene_type:complete
MAVSPAPIVFSEIASYAKTYRVEDFEQFLILIKSLDTKYLQMSGERTKAKSKNKDNGRMTERFHG